MISFGLDSGVVFDTMRNEGLDEKGVECSFLAFEGYGGVIFRLPPVFRSFEIEIHPDETIFSTFSEELIGLDNKSSIVRYVYF